MTRFLDIGGPQMPAQSARVIYEVVAGMIPGQAESEHTRRFGVTSEEWHGENGMARMLEEWHKALAYAFHLQLLCANGMTCNWVRVDFLWP